MPIVRLDNIQQFAAINLTLDPGVIGGPVIVPSCAQIVLIWFDESGVTATNVLYGRYSGPFAGTVTQANGILTALTTGTPWTTLATFLPTATGLAFVSIRDVAVADQPVITSSLPGATGSSASAPLPAEVAACLTKRTALSGPSGRGRLYVPGLATNALGAGNVIAAGCVTALNNWGGTITGALNTQGYVHVLGLPARQAYTGSSGTQHPARAATSVPVTSVACRDNHWDSQRRRGLR